MKDPSYRTCYKLWQFMESYDDVGYTIEERDTALEFDEEYLLQMYTNMITNYTVFKSLLESDPRKMSELAEKKYEPVRPKFVKEIKEEIVEDRNIPDVEIRQVFVEEVTQAQLEAEEKLKQETERCQELERQNGDLEWEKETISKQLDFETQARIQAEQQSDVLQAQFDAVQSELDNEKGEKKALEEQLHEAELAKEAAERHAEEEMATVRREADELVASVKKQAEQELEAAKAQAEADLTAVKQESERALAELKHQTEEARVIAEKEAAGALAAPPCARHPGSSLPAPFFVPPVLPPPHASHLRARWQTILFLLPAPCAVHPAVPAAPHAPVRHALPFSGRPSASPVLPASSPLAPSAHPAPQSDAPAPPAAALQPALRQSPSLR